MNTIGYFEIQVNEPEKSLEFYTNVFNWKFTEQSGLPIRYWQIETDGIGGGLLERPAKAPPPECGTNAFTCSIQVADFDSTAETILNNGGQVAMANSRFRENVGRVILLTMAAILSEFLK